MTQSTLQTQKQSYSHFIFEKDLKIIPDFVNSNSKNFKFSKLFLYKRTTFEFLHVIEREIDAIQFDFDERTAIALEIHVKKYFVVINNQITITIIISKTYSIISNDNTIKNRIILTMKTVFCICN